MSSRSRLFTPVFVLVWVAGLLREQAWSLGVFIGMGLAVYLLWDRALVKGRKAVESRIS